MRISIGFIMMILAALPAAAHQCILEGSSAAAIQSYNFCKADLANGTAGHAGDGQAAELARLQAENELLKARLDDVRQRLLGLLGDL